MSVLAIGEALTVQFPMVNHAIGIGWMPITPEVAKQKRGGEEGIIFHDELEAKLAEFNSWMSADSIRQVIEKLEAIPPTIPPGSRYVCPRRSKFDPASPETNLRIPHRVAASPGVPQNTRVILPRTGLTQILACRGDAPSDR